MMARTAAAVSPAESRRREAKMATTRRLTRAMVDDETAIAGGNHPKHASGVPMAAVRGSEAHAHLEMVLAVLVHPCLFRGSLRVGAWRQRHRHPCRRETLWTGGDWEDVAREDEEEGEAVRGEEGEMDGMVAGGVEKVVRVAVAGAKG